MIGTREARQLAETALDFAQIPLGRTRPFFLNHLITVRCNLSCPFCYVSGPEQREYNKVHFPRSMEMDTAEMAHFYRQLVKERFRLAVIVGGEPLLRTDLDDLLKVLQGRVFTTVFTNGFLLEQRHELIRRADFLFVSLDAPDAQHDELRECPGSFERAIAGIEEVRRHQPHSRIALNMTVTEHNVDRVGAMIRFGREIDLPIAFQPPSFEGQFALDDRPVELGRKTTPSQPRVSDAFRLIRDASLHGARILGSHAFFDLVVRDQKTYPCHYPGYVLGPVLPNGDVVGCVDSKVIANVRKQPVRDILRSRPYRANAAAGPSCSKGCRDWGIHDLSALHDRRFLWPDLRRYYRGLAPTVVGRRPAA